MNSSFFSDPHRASDGARAASLKDIFEDRVKNVLLQTTLQPKQFESQLTVISAAAENANAVAIITAALGGQDQNLIDSVLRFVSEFQHECKM